MRVRNLDDVFATFDATWEPRIVTTVNDFDVRVARCDGEHTWHRHADTDEFAVSSTALEPTRAPASSCSSHAARRARATRETSST